MATTKRELVRRVAQTTGHKQNVAKEIIQKFLDEIVDELAQGHRLEFREFGIFDTIHKRERVARNPRTGATVTVPPKTVVYFKVGRLMKARVRDLQAQAKAQAAGEKANGSGTAALGS